MFLRDLHRLMRGLPQAGRPGGFPRVGAGGAALDDGALNPILVIMIQPFAGIFGKVLFGGPGQAYGRTFEIDENHAERFIACRACRWSEL